MSRATAAATLLALVAAGCVTPPADVTTASQDAGMLPHFDLTDAHDHKDRASHDVKWNVDLLGYDPIAPSAQELGRYNQVVVSGTRAFVSVYSLANHSSPGLAVLNVSGDDPVLVGTLATPDLTPIDVFPSADGKHVFLAGHRDNRVALPAAAQTCTGTPMLNLCTPMVPSGVYMVNVEDETDPKLVAKYLSAPSGAHTVKAHDLGGETYIFIASYGFSYANRLASAVEIAKVSKGPTGETQIVPVTKFFADRMSGQQGGASVFVHDMWVEEHGVTGKPLLYVAYWDGGVVIADLTDPERPQEIADWSDFDAATYGNVHFVRPVGMIGERHITLATPEFGQAEHAGEAYVIDTTDPTKPQLLAKWVLPGNPVNDGGYRFSPHNFDPRGSMVVYGHYHGGVWALDLADPEGPVVKGYVFPVAPEATNSADDAPNVWNAVWMDDGSFVVSDAGTGIYHYRLAAEAPGTPPYEAVLASAS